MFVLGGVREGGGCVCWVGLGRGVGWSYGGATEGRV